MKVLVALVFSLCCVVVDSQICTERVLYTKLVPQTFLRPVRTTYQGKCFFRTSRCTKTQWSNMQDVRLVQKTIVDYKKVCCNGYISNSTTTSLQCDPICIPGCENGHCSEPGVCTCNQGYAPNPQSTHRCLPICTKPCDHGTCVGPETCQCDFGYHTVDDSCVPICNIPCINGACVAPDTCVCFPGYRKSERETCDPYCSGSCEHGTCVGPEVCACDIGWQKTEPDGACKPVCDQDCGYGTCVAPNKCNCFQNYTKSQNGACIPVCSSGCPHGSCVGPENCTCDDGWLKVDGKCEPVCEFGCGNGTCVEPYVCHCDHGYVFRLPSNTNSYEPNYESCLPYCVNCSGTCVGPYHCECDSPYVAHHVAEDGGSCDCFDDCAMGDQVCDKTECIIKGDTTTEGTTELSTYDIDVTFGDDLATDSSTLDAETTESLLNETSNIASMVVSDRTGFPIWVYIVAAVALTSAVAIVITIIVVKRKADRFRGDYYVDEEKDGEKVESTSKQQKVKYSDLLKKKKTVKE